MNRYKLLKAGVDVNKGLKRLNIDAAFYEMLLEKFRGDDHYEKLREAMDCRDVKTAFQNAHALKGIAGNLSFERLYDALVPVVEMLREGSMEGTEEYFKRVSEAYEDIMTVLG